MIRNILLTTLDAAANERSLHYYSVQNEYDRDYCEALQCMEASSKYILSRFAIDEILVIGEDASAAAGASTDPIMLKNSSDPKLKTLVNALYAYAKAAEAYAAAN